MATKTHIMKSAEKLTDELHMPSLPKVMLGDVSRSPQRSGFGIEFNATDAWTRKQLPRRLQEACAQEGQENRKEDECSQEVIRQYDWTYTTDYKGT